MKLELQKKANFWNSQIHSMMKEGRENDGICREYKGKIYAARTFAEMLGIEIDSRFPWEWFDEKGNSIEPDYDFL
jgi:hypothetical protein